MSRINFQQNKDIAINWQTATELNTSHYGETFFTQTRYI
jgi:hypothetical protein